MVLHSHLLEPLTCHAEGDTSQHYSQAGGMVRSHKATAFMPNWIYRNVLGMFGLGYSKPKVAAEGGSVAGEKVENDPKDPSTWTESFKAASPAVREVMAHMQENITNTQNAWRDSFVKFDDAYRNLHSVNAGRMAAWETQKAKLTSACEKLRDSMERLHAAKAMCAQMQGEELAQLFKVKGTEPKRFHRFGDIQGCVRQDIETGELKPYPCECIAGDEKTGCVDAVGLTGNTLSCTHILEHELPNLPLADFFSDGGACRINSKDAWSNAIVPKSAVAKLAADLQEQALSPILASALSVLPQCVSISQRAVSFPEGCQSKACSWGSFLVTVDER